MEEIRQIITIGRQYGSGGREVGAKLAEKLGVHFYDKNILRMNSDESGIKESYFHLADERAGNRLLYKIMKGVRPEISQPSYGSDVVSADNLFRFQSEVIKKLAAAESCVIIGRCAGYVLRGTQGLLRVYIYADMEHRIDRITKLGYFAPEDVLKNIKRIDKERREYYRYYTGKDWDDSSNYDLMINTGTVSVEGAVRLLASQIGICQEEPVGNHRNAEKQVE